jgi:hypothetical protein
LKCEFKVKKWIAMIIVIRENNHILFFTKPKQSMAVDDKLIHIYLFVCQHFHRLCPMIERQSNHHQPAFSDQEVLTIYLFGILEKRFTVTDMHKHILDYWAAWFPALPTYAAFNHRLGVIAPALPMLLELCQEYLPWHNIMAEVYLIDSMPIILARGGRAATAKVACAIANKGYCASKKLWYHGVKLHAIVAKGYQCLPRLSYCTLSPASQHDVQTIREQLHTLENCDLYGDKAYFYHDRHACCAERNVHLWAVKPRLRGQATLPVDERLCNSSISRMRQPIESWFHWLQEKTKIECASTVRSTKGLIVHTLGRIAAACLAIIFQL